MRMPSISVSPCVACGQNRSVMPNLTKTGIRSFIHICWHMVARTSVVFGPSSTISRRSACARSVSSRRCKSISVAQGKPTNWKKGVSIASSCNATQTHSSVRAGYCQSFFPAAMIDGGITKKVPFVISFTRRMNCTYTKGDVCYSASNIIIIVNRHFRILV